MTHRTPLFMGTHSEPRCWSPLTEASGFVEPAWLCWTCFAGLHHNKLFVIFQCWLTWGFVWLTSWSFCCMYKPAAGEQLTFIISVGADSSSQWSLTHCESVCVCVCVPEKQKHEVKAQKKIVPEITSKRFWTRRLGPAHWPPTLTGSARFGGKLIVHHF